MNFYRYTIEVIEDDPTELISETGFVIGKSYSDAAKRIEKISTTPSGKCNLVSMELYETDSYSAGVISDAMITEVFDFEKNNKRKEN